MSAGQAGIPAEAVYETPWGQGRVRVNDGRLVKVELPRRGEVSGAAAQRPDTDPPPTRGDMLEASERDLREARRWAAMLEDYFRGERLEFCENDVRLDDLGLGEFAHRVYAALLKVPAGTTVSYGELACMAGYPRAARAVGNVMASNPIPIVVPCHRVVRADGSLGRYGEDPGWKPALLEHESAHGVHASGGSGGLRRKVNSERPSLDTGRCKEGGGS